MICKFARLRNARSDLSLSIIIPGAAFGFRRSCDLKFTADLFIVLVLPSIYFRILHDSFEYRLQFPSVFPFYVDTNGETDQILMS